MKGNILSAIDQLSRLSAVLSAVALVSIVALVTLEVVLRFAFRTSTLLADEYSLYLFLAVLYLGAAYTLQSDRHIKVDIVTNRLGTKPNLILKRSVAVLNLPLFGLLSWRGWHIVVDTYQSNILASTTMATPLYLPMLVIPLGFTVLAMQSLVELIRLFSASRKAVSKSVESSW